jgi:hypothetical protein
MLVGHPIDIIKHVIGQKIYMKAWNFQYQIFGNDENHGKFKI